MSPVKFILGVLLLAVLCSAFDACRRVKPPQNPPDTHPSPRDPAP